MSKKILVCGAGGFIGGHLVNRLKQEGFWVRGVDLKENEFGNNNSDEFLIGDLRNPDVVDNALDGIEEIYQLAADMGGAGYIFTGDHDAEVMHNSATINLNVLHYSTKHSVKKIFYSSSACIYPEYNQMDPDNPKCNEDSAYPAAPDSEYGWEKLFSERLYFSFQRNFNIQVRVARFHNIYGPQGTWTGGREKAPAAICRKVAEVPDNGEIEIWGDGKQTRSFLFIEDCIDAVRAFMDSDFSGPLNIGSEEMITINKLADIAMEVAGKKVRINHVKGPLGVRGRNSDNKLIHEVLQWKPKYNIKAGIKKTYVWIEDQVKQKSSITTL